MYEKIRVQLPETFSHMKEELKKKTKINAKIPVEIFPVRKKKLKDKGRYIFIFCLYLYYRWKFNNQCGGLGSHFNRFNPTTLLCL